MKGNSQKQKNQVPNTNNTVSSKAPKEEFTDPEPHTSIISKPNVETLALAQA
jgi:hypothetical protein